MTESWERSRHARLKLVYNNFITWRPLLLFLPFFSPLLCRRTYGPAYANAYGFYHEGFLSPVFQRKGAQGSNGHLISAREY